MTFQAYGDHVFAQILDSLHVGVFVLDRDGRPFYANAAAIAFLGKGIDPDIRPNELAQTYNVYVGDTDEVYPAERMPLVTGLAGETSGVDDMTILRPDGRLPLQAWGGPIRDRTGAVLYSVAVFTDNRALHKAEEGLRMSERLASLGTLVGGLAHELSNPLGAVLGNLQVAAEALSANQHMEHHAELTESLQDAREGAQRMAAVLRGLRAILRPEHDLGVVDVHVALELALDTAGNELRHRAQIVKDLGPVPRVRGDEAELARVFLNLLLNAARSFPTEKSGHVAVATHTSEQGEAVIRFQDDGRGMVKETAERAFDPFFSAWPDSPRPGLGLWICHRAVTRIGGRVELDSRPGEGTTVTVTLPPAPADAKRARSRKSDPSIRRRRLLVVDDDAMVQRTIARVLRMDHDVLTASSGKEALAVLDKEKVDAVICDLMMPEMSGQQLYARLLETRPALAERMIFLTGGAFTPATEEFVRSTRAPVLEKPFEKAQLLETIEAMLARQT